MTLVKNCWDNSIDSDNTFSKDKAHDLLTDFLDKMHGPFKGTYDRLHKISVRVPCRHGNITFDQIFSKMTFNGCSGQLGKAIMQYVMGLEKIYDRKARSKSPYTKQLRWFGHKKRQLSFAKSPVTFQNVLSQSS